MKSIVMFKGQFHWLSNFETCLIFLDGRAFQSVEHAYQSFKSDDFLWKHFCSINGGQRAGEVKRKSRQIELRHDWEDVKVDIMRRCLIEKFNIPVFKDLLLDTGDRHLSEGNYHNDDFWGVCLKKNEGQNMLGKLLMEIRTNLKNQDENCNPS